MTHLIGSERTINYIPHDLPDFVTLYFAIFFYKSKYIDNYVCIIIKNLLKIKQKYDGGLDFLQIMCNFS